MTTIQNNWLTLADGNKMPQEGLGTYKLTDQAAMTQAVQGAYDSGYRLIDTAQLYENEAVLGNALHAIQPSYFLAW